MSKDLVTSEFKRDATSGALVSNDKTSLEKYKAARAKRVENEARLKAIEGRVERMETVLNSILSTLNSMNKQGS